MNKVEVEAYRERVNKRQKFEADGRNTSAPKAARDGGDDVEEEEIKPVVPLSACIERFVADEVLPDYRSPVTGKPGQASKRVRIGNFPRYLLVQLGRWAACSAPIGPIRGDDDGVEAR